MFTGIIEELGEVVALEAHGDSAVLRVRTTVVGEDIPVGASLAVNGVFGLRELIQRALEFVPVQKVAEAA